MTLNIENEYGEIRVPDYEKVIEGVVIQALDFINCPYECEVNVLLTDKETIKNINNCQRNIDAPTDVLSFPLINYKKPGNFDVAERNPSDNFNPETGELLLGDIVISVDHVYEQAKSYNHSGTRELAFLTAHSMLHLFGFDHVDEEERKKMEEMQEQILNEKGFTRNYEEG